MPELLTTRQACEVLNVHINTLRRWFNEGRAHGVKMGRDWRISRQEIDRLIREGTNGESDNG